MIECRLGGIEVRISPLFGVALTVLLCLDNTRLPLLCFAAALLHECGHLLVLLLLRHPPARVTIGAWGFRIERHRELSLGYGACAAVSLAGPMTNLICAAVLYLCGLRDELMWVHVVTGLLHLLPVISTDGGQALDNLFCLFAAETTAHRALRWISYVILFLLTVLGCFILLYTGYNFSLLALCLYLASGIFFDSTH